MSLSNSHRSETVQDLSGSVREYPAVEADRRPTGTAPQLTPLLIGINELAALLSRSIPSLHRDDAAGRLPAALRIGGSKRWRYSDIAEWVELGCPSRADFDALRRNRR